MYKEVNYLALLVIQLWSSLYCIFHVFTYAVTTV